MIVFGGNILTEKGNLKADARTGVRDSIASVQIILTNGKQIELDSKGAGNYFGQVGKGEDSVINAKVNLVVTTEDYKEPVKATKKAVEKEAIEFTIE